MKKGMLAGLVVDYVDIIKSEKDMLFIAFPPMTRWLSGLGCLVSVKESRIMFQVSSLTSSFGREQSSRKTNLSTPCLPGVDHACCWSFGTVMLSSTFRASPLGLSLGAAHH
jgi:hypothetical protein